MIKQFLSGYFSFNKRERRGIIALITLVLFFILLPFLFPLFIKQKKYDHSRFEKDIAQLQVSDSSSDDSGESNDDNRYSAHNLPEQRHYDNVSSAELFYFDPNTLSEDGWRKLGIRDKTIATIQKYLSKGGRFYKPGDIQKIWGIRKEDAERLIPYIQIKSNSDAGFKKEYYTNNDPTFAYNKKNATFIPQTIDINSADTAAFIALPGIGSKLANRIISFRNKLGGFYKVEQVAETFGLSDSTFQKIKPRLILSGPSVKQININTATIDELKAHPYIRYYVGNAIIQYRNQHGDFLSVNDIKNVMLVTDSIFQKALPYLKVN